MKFRSRSLSVAVGCSLCAVAFRLLAADDETFGKPAAAPSIQRQLDELKEGQERLFKELEQIRILLQEKQDKVTVAPAPSPPPKIITLNLRGEPFRGESTAKVAIVEYSDFACPYCAQYVRDTFPRIEKDYLRTGKVKYFFRDLPAPEHTNALAAACAARCAGEQGKFWEMHDLLFAAQPALTPSDLVSYAQAVGVDTNQFTQCLASRKYEQVIQHVVGSAERMGLYGTPVFLIGPISDDGTIVRATTVLVGGSDLEGIKSALDEALATPGKPPASQ